jgi:hypothetical protein
MRKRHPASWITAVIVTGTGLVWVAPAAPAEGPRIIVEQAWTRSLPPVATSGELYMVISNTGGASDRLIGGQSPACGMIELNERFRTAQGAMSMRSAGPIEIKAGQRVELKVVGFHLMCMEKKREFKAGVRFPVMLKFEKFGDVPVQVTIRDR